MGLINKVVSFEDIQLERLKETDGQLYREYQDWQMLESHVNPNESDLIRLQAYRFSMPSLLRFWRSVHLPSTTPCQENHIEEKRSKCNHCESGQGFLPQFILCCQGQVGCQDIGIGFDIFRFTYCPWCGKHVYHEVQPKPRKLKDQKVIGVSLDAVILDEFEGGSVDYSAAVRGFFKLEWPPDPDKLFDSPSFNKELK